MSTEPASPDASPLCPVHFPDAQYLGEIVEGWYLGRLTQDSVTDHRDVTLTGVAGRYGLFVEDGGCGQLVGLFPGTPTPCPVNDELDARIDEAFEQQDRGELTDLPPELSRAVAATAAWLRLVRACEFLLSPTQGHDLVAAAQRAGFEPTGTGVLCRFDDWLVDRAGHLVRG